MVELSSEDESNDEGFDMTFIMMMIMLSMLPNMFRTQQQQAQPIYIDLTGGSKYDRDNPPPDRSGSIGTWVWLEELGTWDWQPVSGNFR